MNNISELDQKICSKCGVEKPYSSFSIDKKKKQGYRSDCKECANSYARSKYTAHPNLSITNIDGVDYRKCTICKENKTFEEYSLRNEKPISQCKKCVRLRSKKHFIANKDVYNAYSALARKTGKVKHCEKDNQRRRNRIKNDPVFRLRMYCSGRIRGELHKNGYKKSTSFMKKIGYTIRELKEHLEKQFEPWMNWDNQGKYNRRTWDDNDPSTWKWQMDHIIPHASLPYTSMDDDNFKKSWALENLRPYSAKQNNIDGSTRIRHT